jgi:hypothetical protein
MRISTSDPGRNWYDFGRLVNEVGLTPAQACDLLSLCGHVALNGRPIADEAAVEMALATLRRLGASGELEGGV